GAGGHGASESVRLFPVLIGGMAALTGTGARRGGYRRAARGLVLPFLGLLVACWLLIGFGAMFLARTGELTPVEIEIAWQQAQGGLYGEAMRDNRRRYKLSLFQAT